MIRHDAGRAETVVPGRVAVGTVRGPVRVARRPAVVAPLRWLPLVASGSLVIVSASTVVLRGGGRMAPVLLAFAAVVAVQWILGAVVRLSSWRSSGRWHDNGVIRWLARPLLALAGATGMVPNVDVRHFTVVAVTGQEYRCELVGRPVPAEPGTGDLVEVYGRDRDGLIRVHHIVGVDQATTRPRLPLAAAAARFAYVASVVVSGLGVLAVYWFALRPSG